MAQRSPLDGAYVIQDVNIKDHVTIVLDDSNSSNYDHWRRCFEALFRKLNLGVHINTPPAKAPTGDFQWIMVNDAIVDWFYGTASQKVVDRIGARENREPAYVVWNKIQCLFCEPSTSSGGPYYDYETRQAESALDQSARVEAESYQQEHAEHHHPRRPLALPVPGTGLVAGTDGLPHSSMGVPIIFNIDSDNYSWFIHDLRCRLADRYAEELGGHPVLVEQVPISEPPAKWAYIKLVTGDSETTLAVRGDNLYLIGFMNRDGKWYEFDKPDGDSSSGPYFLPDSFSLGCDYRYRSLLITGEGKDLVDLNLNKKCVMEAVTCLSDYLNGPNQPANKETKEHLARLCVVICESARLNPVHSVVRDGWLSSTQHLVLNKQQVCYVHKWAEMSDALHKGRMHGVEHYSWPSKLSSAGVIDARQALDVVHLLLNTERPQALSLSTTSEVPPVIRFVVNYFSNPDAVHFIKDHYNSLMHMLSDLRAEDPDADDVQGYSVLTGQRGQGPARWIHIDLIVKNSAGGIHKTTVAIRSDNLYLQGFRNSYGPRWLDLSLNYNKFKNYFGEYFFADPSKQKIIRDDAHMLLDASGHNFSLITRHQGCPSTLVEVFALRGSFHAVHRITVFDGRRTQIIYKRDKGTTVDASVRESDLMLTGPDRAISVYGSSFIQLSIAKTADGSKNDNPWLWDCKDAANQAVHDKVLSHSVGDVKFTYAVMSNAVEAKVKVSMVLAEEGAIVPAEDIQVHGTIKARSHKFPAWWSVLFKRGSKEEAQPLVDEYTTVPLARSVVAVPLGDTFEVTGTLHPSVASSNSIVLGMDDIKFQALFNRPQIRGPPEENKTFKTPTLLGIKSIKLTVVWGSS